MELAKIRNKALLAEQAAAESRSITAEALFPELPAETAATGVSLVPDASVPAAAAEHPEPALEPLRFNAPQRRFDPLAVILAGRVAASSLSVGTQADEPVVPTEEAIDERFEEFLCFTLGDEEYGVNIMEIKEIIKPRELTEVPRTPVFVDGVLSLRGVIVPVLAMRRRLEMTPARDRSQERIVIVRHGDGLTGLRVDRVTGVVRIAERCREAAPGVLEGTAREFVAGIGRSDGRMIIILDVASIIDFSFGEVQDHGSRSN
ncbi:chemotaxis protein CheW [Trichlorobacter ammonificans]|uniref:Purine-binding chemotaxis protein CheW n=1 Tax=Trichlorobacter ammonificans TaxID=2916410 RepID=A0ABM9D7N9_9BACT|nr:chemotaxis protein CheW [Trichlorobacter ammonificans]CAH2031176.1 Purine-binding chemotaxis protein CheW [Trichlorobacter ammonificans]